MQEVLNRKEVAQLLKVTPGSIKNYEKRKIIVPVSHINGRPRYAKDQVIKLLSQGVEKQ